MSPGRELQKILKKKLEVKIKKEQIEENLYKDNKSNKKLILPERNDLLNSKKCNELSIASTNYHTDDVQT